MCNLVLTRKNLNIRNRKLLKSTKSIKNNYKEMRSKMEMKLVKPILINLMTNSDYSIMIILLIDFSIKFLLKISKKVIKLSVKRLV